MIYGPNGSGKTNVLDAIHFLSMGKSAFSIQDQFCIREGEDFYRIDGQYENGDGLRSVVVKFQNGSRKLVEVNGSPLKRIAEHIGRIPVIVSAPHDIQLVWGSPELRRSFIDQTISQFDQEYLQALLDYHRLLKQKGAELKRLKTTGDQSFALLETYHQQLSPLNLAIYKKRKEFLESGAPVLNSSYEALAGNDEQVSFAYQSQLTEMDPESYSSSDFRREIQAQRNLFGIHRDDIEFKMKENPAKKVASQGQQKTLILSARIMQRQILSQNRDTRPVLILDDIFDRLDEKRSKNLVAMISAEDFGQVFISDTQIARVKPLLKELRSKTRIFEVKDQQLLEKK